MKKSVIVRLGLTSVVAAALTGCARRQYASCVDQNDRVVADSYCDDMDRDRTRGFSTHYYPYRWYYGSRAFAMGSRATGGGYTPSPGTSTVRGGFGSTGGGEGGGE
jgi:hypothetical protein